MNAAHFHLLVNHFPIFMTVVSVLILSWGMFVKSEAVKKVALVGFIIAGLSVLAVVESGESAEDIVEEIAAVTHDSIEEHEEAADLSKWLTLILGIGGVAGLIMVNKHTKRVQTVLWSLLVFGIITVASLAYTGYIGGQIRHAEEINNTTTTTAEEISHDD